MIQTDSTGVTPVEVYGFVGWISSFVAFALYIAWAYIPDALLHNLGVTYYPDKYWAVALPVWLCVTVVAVYWIYESVCMMGHWTESSRKGGGKGESPCPSDNNGEEEEEEEEEGDQGRYFNCEKNKDSIMPLVRVPVEVVNAVLYLDKTPWQAEEDYKRRRRRRREGQRTEEKNL